jgi:Asp-tRNA(Asn)/Glu-tRNA(Gln) amidotransferase B subunit
MKKINSTQFVNSTINAENMTITEYTKDDQYEFSLQKILEDWSGIDGVTFTIRKESKITD